MSEFEIVNTITKLVIVAIALYLYMCQIVASIECDNGQRVGSEVNFWQKGYFTKFWRYSLAIETTYGYWKWLNSWDSSNTLPSQFRTEKDNKSVRRKKGFDQSNLGLTMTVPTTLTFETEFRGSLQVPRNWCMPDSHLHVADNEFFWPKTSWGSKVQTGSASANFGTS